MNSEALDQSLLEFLSSGSWTYDVVDDHYRLSPAVLSLLGQDSQTLDVDTAWVTEKIHPRDLANLRAAYLEHVKGHREYLEGELRVKQGDGNYLWILLRGVATERDAEGRTKRMFGLIFDISERKRNRSNEQRYRLILDHIPDAISLTDRAGKYLYVNKQYETWTGKSAREVIGRNSQQIFEIRRKDTREKRDHEREVWKKAKTITMERDIQLSPADKSQRAIVTKFPVFGEAGEVLAIGNTITDVTERRLAEQALRLSETRYRRLFESAPAALFESDWSKGKAQIDTLRQQGVTDLRQHLLDNPELIHYRIDVHNIRYANFEAIRMFQADAGKGRNQMFDQPLTESQRLALIEALVGFDAGQSRVSFRGTTTRAGGEEFPMIRDCDLIDNEQDDWSQVLISIRDISFEVNASAALESYQRELQSLAGQISLAEESERHRIASELHDGTVQNLVLARMGLAKIRQGNHTPSDLELIDDVNELLGRSLAETRSLVFEISPPVLYELGLRAAVEWLADQFMQRTGVRVEVMCDARGFTLAEELSIVMFQSVRELFNNITRHAQAGQVILNWKCDAARLQLTVEDDGVGFDVSRVGRSRSAQGGFGLFSITERLKLLGASLDIQSSADGTRATLTAPLLAGH